MSGKLVIDKIKGPLIHNHMEYWKLKTDSFIVGYGYLYNNFAVSDARNIAATGWRVANGADFLSLVQFIDPVGSYFDNVAGTAVKQAGSDNWTIDNLGTNSSGFNAVGSGKRSETNGVFTGLKEYNQLWAQSSFDLADSKSIASLYSTLSAFVVPAEGKGTQTLSPKCGLSVRLIKETTQLVNGQTGAYIGNDGKIYTTICIGNQEWLASDLAETLYRNGDLILNVIDNAAWAALTTGARCAYNNDELNAVKAGIAEVQINSHDILELVEGENIILQLIGKTLTISTPSGRLISDVAGLRAELDARVVGPAAATDRTICIFDGPTGKLIKSANIPIDNYGWYGIQFDTTVSSPSLIRIGESQLHQSLPIQTGMKACLLTDAGAVNYYLDKNDWTKKADGTASVLDGTDGQVMIEVPSHYRKSEADGNLRRIKISEYPLAGFTLVPKFYISAYEAALQRSNNKLSSVVNATSDFRGGNNNAAWDAQANTLLGCPASLISRTDFRTYARNRNAGDTRWNMMAYEQYKSVAFLYFIEFANFDSQAAVNAALDINGFRQGGIGAGVSEMVSAEWNTFNGYYPFIKCGASNSLANGSGEVAVSVTDFGGVGIPRTAKVNRYRGIEMPFGHIWKNCDGIIMDVKTDADGAYSKAYSCAIPASFADALNANYLLLGNVPRVDGYITQMILGELMPLAVGGGSTTYYCDYAYQYIAVSSLRSVLFGAHAYGGAYCGFSLSYSNLGAASVGAFFGSRLCFIP